MLKKLYAKFPFLSPHYKIERFGVSVAAILVLMMVVCVSIFGKHNSEISNFVGNQVRYTESGTTSKTGHAYTVENIFSDSSGTQCFLLLKWSDMSTMSRNASDYQMFLTGSSYNVRQTKLQCSPNGSIYVFGSTGYMGLYLVDTNGFPNQIIKLTLRCNEELVTGGTVDTSIYSDDSYRNHDQADIYFNPGGSDKTVMEFLNDGDMEVTNMYYQMVVHDKEQELRDDLNSQLEAMQAEIGIMHSYEKRLDDDEIVWNTMVAEEIMNDEVTYSDDTGMYYLNTDYVCPKGLDFVWQDTSVWTGYLSGLTDSTYSAFYKQKQAEEDDVPSYTKLTWYKVDGSEFDYNSYTLNTLDTSIKNDIDSCVAVWQEYYTMKNKYQQGLMDLIALEASLHDDWSRYTVITTLDNEKLLLTY